MGIRLKPIHSPKSIEYLRAHVDPDKYFPQETEFLSLPAAYGKAWRSLGIQHVDMPEIRQLAKGIHPITGGRLTARNRAANGGKRTAYLSIIMHAPKSVSLLSELGGHIAVREAFRYAAGGVLAAMEQELAGFRIRKAGSENLNRLHVTGQMAYLRRVETDSRHGDPHLHEHIEVFNVTPDPTDPRHPFKALSMHAMIREQKRLTLDFHLALARGLEKLGYELLWDGAGNFEVRGVSPELIAKFSSGRLAIKEALAELDSVSAGSAIASDELARVERSCRPHKQHWTQTELRDRWRQRTTPSEQVELKRVIEQASQRLRERQAKHAFDTSVLDPLQPGRPRTPADQAGLTPGQPGTNQQK